MASNMYAVVDGHEVDLPANFNDLAPEEQQSVIDQVVADVKSRTESSPLGAFGRAAGQAVWMEAADEIGGNVAAVLPSAITNLIDGNPKYTSIWDGDEPVSIEKFKKVRDSNIDAARSLLRRDAASRPVATGLGTGAGALAGIGLAVALPETAPLRLGQVAALTPRVAGALKSAKTASKGAKVAGTLAKQTAAGAAWGGGTGYMAGEDSHEDRLSSAKTGAAWGAGGGLLLGTGAQAGRAAWNKFVTKPRLYRNDPAAFADRYIFKPGMSEEAKRHQADWAAALAERMKRSEERTGERGNVSAATALDATRRAKDGLISQIGQYADQTSRVFATEAIQMAGKAPTDEVMKVAARITDPDARKAVEDFVRYYDDILPGLQGASDDTGGSEIMSFIGTLASNSANAGRVINFGKSLVGKDTDKKISRELKKIRAYPDAYIATRDRLGPAPVHSSRDRVRDLAEEATKTKEASQQATAEKAEEAARRRAEAEAIQMRINEIQQTGPEGAFVPPRRGVTQSDEAYRSDKIAAFKAYRKARGEEQSAAREQLDKRWSDAQESIRRARARRAAQQAQKPFGRTNTRPDDAGVLKPVYDEEAYKASTQRRNEEQKANADGFVQRVPEDQREAVRSIIQEVIDGVNNRSEALERAKSAIRSRLGIERSVLDEWSDDLADVFTPKAHRERKAAEDSKVIKRAKAATNKKKAEPGK